MMGSGKGNVPTLAGWAVIALLGAGVFALLYNSFAFHPLSSACFGLAASLFMLLLLSGTDYAEDGQATSRVRKIVPQHEPIRPPVREGVVPTRVRSAPVASTIDAPLAAEIGSTAGRLRLTGPRGGKADDLKVLEGIGPALEKLLNSLGIYHFDQIAVLSDTDVASVDAEMKTFKGRIARDRWVAQAKIIVTEGLEAFKERAKTNNY